MPSICCTHHSKIHPDDMSKEHKPWFQLLLCTAIAFLFPICSYGAKDWRHSNPLISNILKGHGIRSIVSGDISLVLNHPLAYPIFHGQSALRSLAEDNDDSCLEMIQQELSPNDNDDMIDESNSKAKVALLLLLAGHGDAAHDVLLGTTLDNLKEAEYAATHRGQTNWAQEHPLTDLDDVLHSLIHRIYEGSRKGEGGYTGYENAQYWCAGGPKRYEEPIVAKEMRQDDGSTSTATRTSSILAKVYQELCQVALRSAPICVSRGIIAQPSDITSTTCDGTSSIITQRVKQSGEKTGVTHNIIRGGGKFRDVFVPEGCWDPIVFCQLLLENETGRTKKDQSILQRELEYLTEKELELLAKYLLV